MFLSVCNFVLSFPFFRRSQKLYVPIKAFISAAVPIVSPHTVNMQKHEKTGEILAWSVAKATEMRYNKTIMTRAAVFTGLPVPGAKNTGGFHEFMR